MANEKKSKSKGWNSGSWGPNSYLKTKVCYACKYYSQCAIHVNKMAKCASVEKKSRSNMYCLM